MKKIVKLTEQDLIHIVRKIINEQNENVKCPPKVKVSKQLVDSKLNFIVKEVDYWINSEQTTKILNEIDSKYRNVVKKILVESKPAIIETNKKLLYSTYGIIPTYNQTSDVTNIVNTFYRGIVSEIEGNFITKNLMRAFINKDNIQSTKNIVSSVLDKIFFIIRRITYDPYKEASFEIKKNLPKCIDGSSSYVGGKPILADVKKELVNQKSNINKLLDTYV
jgi:hypothetical protein